MVFDGFLENNCPGGGALALTIFCLRGRGFALSLCPTSGEFAHSKNFPVVLLRRDGQAWN